MWGKEEIELKLLQKLEQSGHFPKLPQACPPPRPSPPPHPLCGKPSRDGRIICLIGFCTGCAVVAAEPAQCLETWLGKLRTLVKALDGKRGRVLVGRIYVTIWKAIRSRYLASFPSDNLTSYNQSEDQKWQLKMEKGTIWKAKYVKHICLTYSHKPNIQQTSSLWK